MNRINLLLLFLLLPLLTTAQESGMLKLKLTKVDAAVKSVAISPDGKFIAAGYDNAQLHIWDIATGEITKSLSGHQRSVNAIIFAPEGRTLISGGLRAVIEHDITDGKIEKTFKGPVTEVMSLDLYKNSRLIAGSYEDKFFTWNYISSEQLLKVPGHEKSVLSVAVSPDGKTVATGSLDLSIRLWETETGKELKVLRGHTGNIFDLEFTPDGKYLVSASLDKTIKIWDIEEGKYFRTLAGHGESVMAISISPDGKHLLSCSYDKTIRLWGLTDGKTIYAFNEHSDIINSVVFAKDGSHFVSGANTKELFYWEINPDVYVNAYFKDKVEKEQAENNLFRPKEKDEKAADYKLRKDKQDEFTRMLYEKYYNQYYLMIKNKAIRESSNQGVNIQYQEN